MSLWKELDKARSSIPHVEFKEFEDEARKVIEEYSKISPDKITKELELRVCGAIIKYLITKHPFIEDCTEFAISEQLGIPRSRLRRLLGLLEWQGIVESISIGNAQPYVVKDLSKALAERYLSFSEEEAAKLIRIFLHTSWIGGCVPYHDPLQIVIETVQATLPDQKLINEARLYAVDNFRKWTHVHRPFFPGAVSSTNPGLDDYYLTFMYSVLGAIWPQALTSIYRDVLFELDVPDEITKQEFQKGLKRVSEKNLKLMLKFLQPLHKLIEEYGVDEARKRVTKAISKDEVLSKVGGVSYGERFLGRYKLEPELGFVSSLTQKMTPSHIRLGVNFLRSAHRLAEASGADVTLIAEAKKLEEALEAAARKLEEASSSYS